MQMFSPDHDHPALAAMKQQLTAHFERETAKLQAIIESHYSSLVRACDET